MGDHHRDRREGLVHLQVPHSGRRLCRPGHRRSDHIPLPANPTGDPGPQSIAAGPNGAVWFTQEVKGNIAKVNNEGVITEAKTVKGSGPFGITVALNGDPWYTMQAANKIATFQLR